MLVLDKKNTKEKTPQEILVDQINELKGGYIACYDNGNLLYYGYIGSCSYLLGKMLMLSFFESITRLREGRRVLVHEYHSHIKDHFVVLHTNNFDYTTSPTGVITISNDIEKIVLRPDIKIQ